MDLHPDPVELPLQRRGAEALECAGHVVARRGEHRLHRAPDLEPEAGQRVDPTRQSCRRDRADRAAQHRRPAYGSGRDLRGLGDRLEHHALERTLAQLAGEQAAQQLLLRLGGPAEQVADEPEPRRLRPRPRQRRDALELGVDLADPEPRLRDRRR